MKESAASSSLLLAVFIHIPSAVANESGAGVGGNGRALIMSTIDFSLYNVATRIPKMSLWTFTSLDFPLAVTFVFLLLLPTSR